MAREFKSISLSRRSRYKQLHIEAPGCIINIRIDLSDADGRPMTYVSVTADGDRYAGDPEWWCDGQRGETGRRISHHTDEGIGAMCCCGKPTLNGEPGYSWDGKSFSIRPVAPPDIAESDKLIYDEPGRCGGIDCHSHHFRLVKARIGFDVLVRHGAGDERVGSGRVGSLMVPGMAAMDSNGRYWLMHTIYSAHSDATESAKQKRDQVWRKAAAEKRIKTRKVRQGVKVWIEDPPAPQTQENGRTWRYAVKAAQA